MRGTMAAGLSLLLALAGAAFAGDVSIPVDDLTSGGVGHAPRSQMQPWPDPKGEHSAARVEAESPLVCPFAAGAPADEGSPGDGNGKPARPARAATDDELVTLVAAMAGTHDFTISADRRTLRVPDANAAAVRGALARIRAQRPGFVDLAFSLDALDGGAWTTVIAGEEPVFPGDEAVFHDEIAASYLSDFDVEIAQGSQIPDPVLQLLRSGSHVTLRVLPLPGRDAAVVEADAVVATSEEAEPMHPAYSEMADIDRAVVGVESAALTLRVKSGAPATCGWTGRDGRSMRLTVTARWAAAAPDAGSTALVWSPLLGGTGVVERSHIPEALQSAKAEETEEMPRFGRGVEFSLAPPGIANVAGDHGATIGFGNGHLDLFDGAGAAAARDALVAAFDEENRAVAVDVVAVDVPKGAEMPADGSPPGGAREVLRVSAPVRMGINGLFVAAEGRTFLQDYDVEVAQASSIPDPIVGVLLTGSFTNVRVRPGLGGAPAYVDLDVVLSKLMSMDTQTVPVLVPMPVAMGPHMEVDVPNGEGGTKKVGVDPLASATATAFRSQYNVEKPTVHQTRITVTLPLSPDGRAVLRRTLPGWLGVGHELVLIVRAK
jgi:hypothetical protein